MQLVPLFVCAACPVEGGEWGCLLWHARSRRSWWAGESALNAFFRGGHKG